MSFIQINKLDATPDNISAPAQINVSYDLNGNKGTPVDLYYQLNSGNNVYFIQENGGLTKEIIMTTVLKSTTTPVYQNLTLTKVASQEDSDYCYIYVQAVNKLNNMSDIKHYTINFQ